MIVLFDFLKFTFRPANFADWKTKVNIGFTYLKTEDKVDWSGNPITVNTFEGWYRGLKIIQKQTLRIGIGEEFIEDNRILISGSMHKSAKRSPGYPDGENFSRFILDELIDQFQLMSEALFFDLDNALLLNIEYGFNLQIPGSPKSFISSNLLSFQGKFFNEFESSRTKSIGSNINFQEFSIKVYDKGFQYGLDYNLLRIEIKFKKLRALKGIGIKYLSDLINEGKIRRLHELFLRKWKKVVLYDDQMLGLNKKQREFYLKCGQKGYLQALKAKKDKKLYYYISKLRKLNQEFGNSRINHFDKLINDEFECCLQL